MNIDAVVLGLIAMADLALIAHLRQRRRTAMKEDRVMRSLVLAVQRENGVVVMPRRWFCVKAS
ncbi:MAG TPA: hypothetical protein VMH28_10860 [Candidatus Acidoferrales bacterium]|nr:hypothetical protein [Candidatus Acidoferrales bacterium]